jgi:hypothetical protein
VGNAGRLRAAAARIDITPEPGCRLAGGAFGAAGGLRHPLAARALMARAGESGVLLVSGDLLGFAPEDARALRGRVADRAGLDRAHVMLCATHTHGGPCTVGLRAWGPVDRAYLDWLSGRLVTLAGRVAGQLAPASIRSGWTTCGGVSRNRTSYGQGLVDDAVGVIRVEADGGRAIATVVNYACHPVNMHGTGLISADFPFFLEKCIQGETGAEAPVLFLPGASGDLNPANFGFRPEEAATEAGARRREADAAETGGKIAAAVLSIMPCAARTGSGRVAACEQAIEFPLEPLPPAKELERIAEESARAAAARPGAGPTDWAYCDAASRREWAEEALAARRSAPVTEVVLQAMCVGGARIVAIPGEPFTRYGQAIRSGNGGEIFVATTANGEIGYFPSPEGYARQTYEAVVVPRLLGLQAFTPDCGDRLTRAAGEVLLRLGGAD